MAVCRTLAVAYPSKPGRHSGSTCLYRGKETAHDMAMKYAILRLKAPRAEGGFWEAFRLGLVDFGSTGEQYYDESGYPFPDEVHAFVHDWLNLSSDFQIAMSKVRDLRREHNAGTVEGVHGKGNEGQSTAPEGPRK